MTDLPSVEDVVSMWTNVNKSAAFAGQKYLVALLRAHYPDTPTRLLAARVKEALETTHAYGIHAPRRRRFLTSYYSFPKFYRLLEVDLCHVEKLSEANDDVHFLIVGVEGASRRIFVETCINKEAETVAAAMEKLLLTMPQIVEVVRSDSGTEFKSRIFRALMKKYNIKQQFATNDSKAALVERAIQKVQGRIHRFLTFTNQNRYVDVLQKIVRALNMTPHHYSGVPALRFDPDKDLYRVWEANVLRHQPALSAERARHRPFKFQIGDKVRMSRYYDPLRKGFAGYHTPEYFTIVARHVGVPKTYELQDVTGSRLVGEVNEKELIIARDHPDSTYPIAKIWQRRTRRGKKEWLVSFQSWPKTHKVWVAAQ